MPSASNATTGMLPTPSSTTSNKTNKAFHKKLEITTIDPFNLTDSNLKRRTNENSSLKNPIIIIPGYGAPAKSYETFRQVLTSSLPPDTSITIAPVTYRQWAMTVGGRPMTAVLKVIDTTVQQVLRTTGKKRVTLCAHSAGGWISRVYLGDTPYPSGNSGICWNGRRFVDQLICLGTPHTSGEPVTKTNMQFVNNNYPHAFHDDVEYLNFAGDGVSVLPFHGRLWHFWHPQWISRLSYSLTDPDITDEDHAVGDGKFLFLFLFLVFFHLPTNSLSLSVTTSGLINSFNAGGKKFY